MAKEKLTEMLRILPIHKPDVDQVRDLFPHLSSDEIQEVLTIGEKGRSNYVAVPSLRVNGAFQIVTFNPEYKNDKDGKVTPVRLSWSYAGRTRESYAGGRSHEDVFPPYKHMDKAIAFARDNWGSDLVLDDWVDFVEVYVQDPTDLHKSSFSQGSPKTKAVVRFTTIRSWSEIINDHSKPESQVIDDVIAQITTDYLIARELKGGRGGHTEFNCTYDGAGLGLSGCGEWGNTFKDDQMRCGWNTPLPSKVADYLIAKGFQFGQDPAVARQKEAQRFEQYARK